MNITGQITSVFMIDSGSMFGKFKMIDGKTIDIVFLSDQREGSPDLDRDFGDAVPDGTYREITLPGFTLEKTWGQNPDGKSVTYFFVTENSVSVEGLCDFNEHDARQMRAWRASERR